MNKSTLFFNIEFVWFATKPRKFLVQPILLEINAPVKICGILNKIIYI